MARFDRAIATAERLIARNGQSVVWRQVAQGAPADASKPWKPSVEADTNKAAVICFLPMTRENKELLTYLRGTNDVPTGYIMGLMAGNVDFLPAMKDIVIRDGSVLRVKAIDCLAPNGQKVLYTIDFEA